MRLIKGDTTNKLMADENKQIRDINDIYTPEHTDEEGNVIPEHFPYYTTIIYLPLSMTLEKAMELYVEEEID